MSGKMVNRAIVLVCLSTSSEGPEWQVLHHLMKTVKDGYEKRKNLGMKEGNFITLVTDPCLESISGIPLNIWLKCFELLPSKTPPTPLAASVSSKSRVHHMTWEELCDWSVSENTCCHDFAKEQARIANEIHCLLDHIPWDVEEYTLLDVFVSTSTSTSPAPELYGALLRLREWLNANIYFITDNESVTDKVDDSTSWKELCECLPAYTGSLVNTTEALSVPVFWRGPLRIHEHKTKPSQAIHNMTFPGYTLSLHSDIPISQELLVSTGMDINSTHHPSHLELVQVLDIRDVPHLWLSPLTVRLSVDPSFNHSPSTAVFREIFQDTSSSSNTGILLRLYGHCPNEHRNMSHSTTEEWRVHVLEKEIPGSPSSISSTLSMSDSPGPLLIAVPSHLQCHTTSRSCDAWVLWKPETMQSTASALMRLQSSKTIRNETDESTFKFLDTLPFVCVGKDIESRSSNITTQLYTRKNFLRDISEQQKHELLQTPSKWPEIIALQNLEGMLRKQIKRRNTSELTLGGVTAPPPSGTSSLPNAMEVLQCFTDTGSPNQKLSPVAMDLSSTDRIRPIQMIDPAPSPVSYRKVLNSTPTTARKYHGISYCLSEDDTSRDCKLTKVQQRYVSSERSCNCSNYQTPVKNKEWRNRKSISKAKKSQSQTESNQPQTGSCKTHSGTDISQIETHKRQSKSQQTGATICSDSETVSPISSVFHSSSGESLCHGGVMNDDKTQVELTTTDNEKQEDNIKPNTTKNMKKQLEQIIVSSLKTNGMQRTHQYFKKCYVRLFKISKVFVKDLKTNIDIERQMKEIVDFNVQQVIDFELSQANVSL